jgi:hypothetical protein
MNLIIFQVKYFDLDCTKISILKYEAKIKFILNED